MPNKEVSGTVDVPFRQSVKYENSSVDLRSDELVGLAQIGAPRCGIAPEETKKGGNEICVGDKGIVQMCSVGQGHEWKQRPVILGCWVGSFFGNAMLNFGAAVYLSQPGSSMNPSSYSFQDTSSGSRVSRGSPCMVEIYDQDNCVLFMMGSHRAEP